MFYIANQSHPICLCKIARDSKEQWLSLTSLTNNVNFTRILAATSRIRHQHCNYRHFCFQLQLDCEPHINDKTFTWKEKAIFFDETRLQCPFQRELLKGAAVESVNFKYIRRKRDQRAVEVLLVNTSTFSWVYGQHTYRTARPTRVTSNSDKYWKHLREESKRGRYQVIFECQLEPPF